MQKLFISAALLLAAGVAQAEKADSSKPTQIAFDQLDADDVKQIKTFTGNVVLTRGTLLMKSPKAVVTEDPEGYQYVVLHGAPGRRPSARSGRRRRPVGGRPGRPHRIRQQDRAGEAVLQGPDQAPGRPKTASQVDGEFISYDSRKEVYAVKNSRPARASRAPAAARW
jgi:lipopolysaccharide export system protein LptA